MSSSVAFDAAPILLPSEQRQELEQLGAALRLTTEQATQDARRFDVAPDGDEDERGPLDEDHR